MASSSTRLGSVLRDNWGGTAADIGDDMLRLVQRFLDNGQAVDDLTLVVVRIASPRVDSGSEISDGAHLVEVL